MGKKLIGIAVIAIMLLGVFGLTGCGDEGAVAGKAELLSAINQWMSVESYTETIDVTVRGDSEEVTKAKTTARFSKRDGAYISEGALEQDMKKTCDFYSADGFFYILSANSSIGGIKFRLEERISINTFFSKNFGVITSELVEQLSDETAFRAKKNKDCWVYSFRTINLHELIEGCTITVDYIVTVDSDGRILEIAQNSLTELGGLTVRSGYSISKYDYTPVEVNLPNNLDSYLEQGGGVIGI